MTLLAISSIAAAVVFLLALAWLLARPLPQETLAIHDGARDLLLSQHAQRLPQLQHSLAGTDTPYVKHYGSPQIEKHWRDDRQRVLESFLLALGEDFAHLEQLAALATAMLPKDSAPPGNTPFSLQLEFRANYRLAFLLLRMRSPACTPRITRLAELLGNLSARTEASLAKLTSVPAPEPSAALSKIPPD
jgi:hypothetical protein